MNDTEQRSRHGWRTVQKGTVVENLRHVVEVFSGVYRESPHPAPDDQMMVTATSDSASGERTGLTMGDLRELLRLVEIQQAQQDLP